MKQGKWNYIEDITYRVVNVRLLPVSDPKMHWQNAFAGEIIQAVEVTGRGESFLISNQDGSGLRKIHRGGGPDSGSWHIADHELLDEVTDESLWFSYDPALWDAIERKSDAWSAKHFPEEHKRSQALKASILLMRSGNYHIGSRGEILPGKRPGSFSQIR
jgi:hypothetical protein